ncbi:MAG TPA: hypothetical protein VKF15_02755 [Nitrososphaerales archaeon]|nr:hypothetical protein [Nitrososphaerales archaeon]
MPKCSFCGKETPQPDAVYCSYCGSSLQQRGSGISTAPYQAQPIQEGHGIGGRGSADPSQRYERALRRVERLGSIALVLSVFVLILVLA